MPKLQVVKIGYESFDALHALGLGIFVAEAIGHFVEIVDDGVSYLISFSKTPHISYWNVFDKLLKLPTEKDLFNFDKKKRLSPKLLTLDGLLAALFTTLGPRIMSLHDLQIKKELSPEMVEMTLEKVKKAITRWRSSVERKSQGMAKTDFWGNLFTSYTSEDYAFPTPATSTLHPINILMTIEPSLSYSTRQAFSDGNVSHRSNMTVNNFPYAPLFVFIGASRFLRAQRVNNELVNFYVPIPSSVKLDAQKFFMPLAYSPFTPNVALLMFCMSLVKYENMSWRGVIHQTLQTQKANQSISVNRAIFNFGWLGKLEKKTLKNWQLVYLKARELNLETDDLTDFLISHEPAKLVEHLLNWSRVIIYSKNSTRLRQYCLTDLKEITLMIDENHDLPLSSILLNEKGTIRFGHALRQLKATQNGTLREIIDDLEVVNTQESLILILARAVEACVIQDSKYEFTIIPDDRDLYFLLLDVQKFGVKQVASVLVILAALHYPRKEESNISAAESKAITKEYSND